MLYLSGICIVNKKCNNNYFHLNKPFKVVLLVGFVWHESDICEIMLLSVKNRHGFAARKSSDASCDTSCIQSGTVNCELH